MVARFAGLLCVGALQGLPSGWDESLPANKAATFRETVDRKQYDVAEKMVFSLVDAYVQAGRLLESKESAADPPAREALAAAKSDRQRIAEVFEKVVKDPRPPEELRTEILARLDVRTGDGDKLLLKSLQLKHVQEAPRSLAAAARSLGSFRRTQHLDALERLLADRRAPVLKATASALGEFWGENEETRKRIVDGLVLAYSDCGYSIDPVSRKRVHFDRANEWVTWWGLAKSKPLADGVDRPSIKLDGLQPGPAPDKR